MSQKAHLTRVRLYYIYSMSDLNPKNTKPKLKLFAFKVRPLNERHAKRRMRKIHLSTKKKRTNAKIGADASQVFFLRRL